MCRARMWESPPRPHSVCRLRQRRRHGNPPVGGRPGGGVLQKRGSIVTVGPRCFHRFRSAHTPLPARNPGEAATHRACFPRASECLFAGICACYPQVVPQVVENVGKSETDTPHTPLFLGIVGIAHFWEATGACAPDPVRPPVAASAHGGFGPVPPGATDALRLIDGAGADLYTSLPLRETQPWPARGSRSGRIEVE